MYELPPNATPVFSKILILFDTCFWNLCQQVRWLQYPTVDEDIILQRSNSLFVCLSLHKFQPHSLFAYECSIPSFQNHWIYILQTSHYDTDRSKMTANVFMKWRRRTLSYAWVKSVSLPCFASGSADHFSLIYSVIKVSDNFATNLKRVYFIYSSSKEP